MRLVLKPASRLKAPILHLFSRTLLVTSSPAAVAFQILPCRRRKALVFATKSAAPIFRCRTMTTACEEKPMAVQVRETIELNDTEKKIFDRLLGTLRHFNLETQLRVAGGWVRDKLLGKECYDIDIALDNMLGSEFGEKVKSYLEFIGEEAEGFAVISSNPEQSKHLETARLRLLGVWIDFVNLRCEEYSESSRIPTMKFGTAEEDAFRRDLTINSLFYNINTKSVEDFTKRGIDDLKSGKIVTPLPPKSTFLDDPLRVLRAVRFGARFNFILDDELKKAASDDDVKAALGAKISRERIGTEIDLMVSGAQPVKAITYISDLSLFWIVFNIPSDSVPTVLEECNRLCCAYMNVAWNLIQRIGCSTFSGEQIRLCLYAALFLPFRKTTYMQKGKKIPVVSYIFRDSLKRKASDAEAVVNIHNSLEKFLSLIPSLTTDENVKLNEVEWERESFDVPVSSKLRVLTGFLLRGVKDFWRVSLLISTLLYRAGVDDTEDYLSRHFQLDKKRDLFVEVEGSVKTLGLDKVWDLKPLANGKDIMNVLQLKAGGPLVKEWQQKVLAWQLAHPSGTLEECLEWMRETNSKRARTA